MIFNRTSTRDFLSLNQNIAFFVRCCFCGAPPCGARARPTRAHPRATDKMVAPQRCHTPTILYFLSYFTSFYFIRFLCGVSCEGAPTRLPHVGACATGARSRPNQRRQTNNSINFQFLLNKPLLFFPFQNAIARF